MGDAQGGEGALKLGAGIAPVGGGLMAKQGEAIGVQGQWQAVDGEGAAKVLEVVPRGIGRDEGAGEELAGMIIHRKQEGLFGGGGPPLVNRGVVLPEFADAGPLPAAAGFGAGRGRVDEEREVTAGVGGDGFAVAVERESGGQFIRDELVIGRALQREEGLQKLMHGRRPSHAMSAAGESQGQGRRVLEPGGAEAEQMGATDAQELGGGVWIEVAAVEAR